MQTFLNRELTKKAIAYFRISVYATNQRKQGKNLLSYVVVSIINLKGGSGKTSTIINLGGVLREKGHVPLLIDCDPQQSASQWAVQGGDVFPFHVSPLTIGKNAGTFHSKLQKLIAKHKADFILFDSPPALASESLVAALLSDIVLIPVGASPLDIWATEEALKAVKEARKERGGEAPKVVIVPSRLLPQTILAKEINTALKDFNEPIGPPITSKVAMVEAAIAGLTVDLYAPNGPSHKEFKLLMTFILKELL